MQTPRQQETLIVRPGAVYLAIAVMFFAITLWFAWMTTHIEQFSNPAEYDAARLVYGAMGTIAFVPGLIFALFWKCRKLTFDAGGIQVVGIFEKSKRYSWNDITDAEVTVEAIGFPCLIRSREKIVAKITRAYRGYGQMIDLLRKRNLIKDSDALAAAETLIALDNMKLKDLARRNKSRD